MSRLGYRTTNYRGMVECTRCGRLVPWIPVDRVWADGIAPPPVIPCLLCTEQERAEEAMGYTPRCSWGHIGGDSALLAAADLDALDKDSRCCAALDAEPAMAWDDEAWAAFTWRMQTSPAFTPTN